MKIHEVIHTIEAISNAKKKGSAKHTYVASTGKITKPAPGFLLFIGCVCVCVFVSVFAPVGQLTDLMLEQKLMEAIITLKNVRLPAYRSPDQLEKKLMTYVS